MFAYRQSIDAEKMGRLGALEKNGFWNYLSCCFGEEMIAMWFKADTCVFHYEVANWLIISVVRSGIQ